VMMGKGLAEKRASKCRRSGIRRHSQMRSYRNILSTQRSEGASLATPGNNPVLAEESSPRWCYQRTRENSGFWYPLHESNCAAPGRELTIYAK
jgi:hypothetical protein